MSWDPHSGKPLPPQFSDNPAFNPYAPRTSGSRTWLWLLLALGGGGLFLVLLCCGGAFGVIAFGVNMMEAELKDKLRDNPKLREHIGEIQSLDTDLTASMAVEGEDTYRYKVRGTKGSGELTVKQHTDDDGNEVIEEASLRLADGKTVQIVP